MATDAIPSKASRKWKLFNVLLSKKRSTKNAAKAHASTNTSLLSLPAELLIPIVNQISFSDILALRLTSRQADSVISHGDVPREWMLSNMPLVNDKDIHRVKKREEILHLYLDLYPPPEEFSFIYILEFRNRVSTAAVLARVIQWFIGNRLNNPEIRLPGYCIIRKKMVLSLLTIQHYLEQLRDECVNLDEMSRQKRKTNPEEDSSKKALRDAHSFQTLPKYPNPKHLLTTHLVFMVLCWVMKVLVGPASQVESHRAKRIFAFGKPLLSDADVRMFVVLNNLRGILFLFLKRSDRRRRKMILSSLEGLCPHHHIRKVDKAKFEAAWSVGNSSYDKSTLPSKEQAAHCLSLTSTMGWHDVWNKPAREILLAHKVLKNEPKGTTFPTGRGCRTLEWTTDIAGYHAPRVQLRRER